MNEKYEESHQAKKKIIKCFTKLNAYIVMEAAQYYRNVDTLQVTLQKFKPNPLVDFSNVSRSERVARKTLQREMVR